MANPDVVNVVLNACDLTAAQLANASCEQMEKVRLKAGAKAIELMACVGQPKKVGDEIYDYTGDIEKLLKIVEIAEKVCQRAKHKGFSGFSLPGGGCLSGCGPSHADLQERYKACCGSVGRIVR